MGQPQGLVDRVGVNLAAPSLEVPRTMNESDNMDRGRHYLVNQTVAPDKELPKTRVLQLPNRFAALCQSLEAVCGFDGLCQQLARTLPRVFRNVGKCLG